MYDMLNGRGSTPADISPCLFARYGITILAAPAKTTAARTVASNAPVSKTIFVLLFIVCGLVVYQLSYLVGRMTDSFPGVFAGSVLCPGLLQIHHVLIALQ